MARASRPLAELAAGALAGVRGVFADIDDTLTTGGKLTAAAYAAMERLRAAGFIVVPITGRPAGWCDHIARMWPVDAVVGENGAFWFAHDDVAKKLVKRFRDDDATRAANRARLAAVRDRILAEVPGAAVASDQLYREADLAIDFCEDVPRLPDAAIDRIVAIMREAGMTAKISSIHVNGWFGRYDKLAMTRTLMLERFGVELDAQRGAFVFVGDSPNDVPMFRYFPLAVGVANIREFAARIEDPPAFVTEAASGAGFVEVAERLLGARAGARSVADQ
ncbi:MAG: HAD-IIB family hydrolase [Burkholderiales bacterium]|nr:HAD-IIB family hydrolase [Burkholderiales bacterium]